MPQTASTVRERVEFQNRQGETLAALLERPAQETRAYAVFAHCFTCSKDIGAATRISRALAARGFAVLRFDFTGLGNSEGDFANTHFTSNVEDLVCAADALRERGHAPALLIGHSLGGAAVLAAADRIPESQAVVTVGAPSDPGHVAHLFGPYLEQIERDGEAQVDLAGRQFTIRREFLQDIGAQVLAEDIAKLKRALLILHSPADEIVELEHARHIYEAAKHPKSFISLDSADHLLTRREDSEYVAETIAAWAGRYVSAADGGSMEDRPQLADGEVFVREGEGNYSNTVYTRTHRLLADEPLEQGGQNTGPTPYDLLLAALGACTTITLRMYANFKKLPLEQVSVKLRKTKVHAEDCKDCEGKEPTEDAIQRELSLTGPLDEKQRARLMQIADRCPVHRLLSRANRIDTRLSD
jgi:putative redox protein